MSRRRLIIIRCHLLFKNRLTVCLVNLENDGSASHVALNVLNAKRKSIEERERYKLPKIEIDSLRQDIKYYEKEVERLRHEDS